MKSAKVIEGYAEPKALLFGAYALGKKKETASTSGNPQLTRAQKPCDECESAHGPKWQKCVHDVSKKGSGDNAYAVCTTSVGQKNSKKESQKPLRESGRFKLVGKIKEAKQQSEGPQGRRFRVTLLQEGIGNLQDCFYYTPEALESAVELFEGAKYFLNHPAESEEQDRPERDVLDIAGYFENVSTDIAEGGETLLMGDLVIINSQSDKIEHCKALMLESLNYSLKHPGQDLVGLSINANGDFDTIALEQFMKEFPVPTSCLPKLLEAQGKGINMIRPVREMTSAFSCDLVTTAGAGGTINKLLEQEKKAMAMKQKHEEDEKEEGMKQEAGAANQDQDMGKDADGQDGDHPDAGQDEQLIMKMLKKYLGDGFSDDDKGLANEAYQKSREMGLDHEEAMKCAGYNMKMAKHMQKKAAEESAAGKDGDGGAGFAKAQPSVGGPGSMPSKDQHDEADGHKESARGDTNVVKMAAEIARLSQKLNTMELEKHVEAKLKESKLPMAATKKFRECIKAVKSIKDFDEKLTIFKEAYSISSEADGTGFIIGTEKQGDISGAGLSFGDCIEE